MNETVTIGLVDDHHITRKALIYLINQIENCRVILDAADTYDLMETLQKGNDPNILIMELNGFKTLENLKDIHPDIPIIILTRFDTTLTSDRLIYLGARAVLEKDTDEKELKKAISTVRKEGYYFNTAALRKMSVFLNKDGPQNRKSRLLFTDREWEFLPFVPTEMTHKQIAEKMQTTAKVVNKINSGLFEKLDVKNRAALAMKVVSHGLFHTVAT